MQRLLKLKWRLLPLLGALVIVSIPLAQNFWVHHEVSVDASKAEARLNESPAVTKIQGEPSRIVIPSISIDLSVVPQKYSEAAKTWPVSVNAANYATNTAQNNNTRGETLIYGHNNRSIFGPILKMKPGAIVYVHTKNGHLFKYSYISSEDITPTKLSIFSDMAKAKAGLKLITCNGPNFEYRHLMSLKLVQAS